MAFVAGGVIALLAWQAYRRGQARSAAMLFGAVTLQIALGIATIMSGVQLWLGVAHQGMAALLLAALVVTAHRLGERAA
jgi:cytochrome c oxidase assembly protein subunit 15